MTPTFDAVGTGGNAGTWPGTSMSGTHTAAAGAALFAFIKTGGSANVSSATFGGMPLTPVGGVPLAGAPGAGSLWLYGLASAPGGLHTVAITGSSANSMCFGTVSYSGVTAVSAPATVFGLGDAFNGYANPSQTLTCSAAQVIVDALACEVAVTAPTGGTNRALVRLVGTFPGNANVLAISDSTASPTTFAATTGGHRWAGLGVVLS